MSDTNQVKSSASGSESVGAALQAATVLGASDGLISENHEAETKAREEALVELEAQWEQAPDSEDEEEEGEGDQGDKTALAKGVRPNIANTANANTGSPSPEVSAPSLEDDSGGSRRLTGNKLVSSPNFGST